MFKKIQSVHVHLYATYTVFTLSLWNKKNFLKSGSEYFFLGGNVWNGETLGLSTSEKETMFSDRYKYVLEKALERGRCWSGEKHLATKRRLTNTRAQNQTHRLTEAEGWGSQADREAVKSPFLSLHLLCVRESGQHYGIREDRSIPWPVLWPQTPVTSTERRFAVWYNVQTPCNSPHIFNLLSIE